MKRLLMLIAMIFCVGFLSQTANAQIVITEVYGGGGATTGSPSFNRDYVELRNVGTTPATCNGCSLQYRAPSGGTGTFSVLTLPDITLNPGQFYLVATSIPGSTTIGPAITPAPDFEATAASGTLNLSATNGIVVLANSTAQFTAATCPATDTTQSARVVDLVGYGTANCFEGAAAAPALTNTTAARRVGNPGTDTNNNSTDFTAAAPNPQNSSSPTAVRLFAYSATQMPGGNLVEWETGGEVDNLGYHLYRVQNGVRTRVTPSLVAGSALIVGAGTEMTAGNSYAWFDTGADPNLPAQYFLEDVDLNGKRTMHDPVAPVYDTARWKRNDRGDGRRHLLLTDIGRRNALSVIMSEGSAAELGLNAAPQGTRDIKKTNTVEEVLRDARRTADGGRILWSRRRNRTAAPVERQAKSKDESGTRGIEAQDNEMDVFAPRLPGRVKDKGAYVSLAGRAAVKIAVRERGWYRVTQAELVAAGMDASTNPNFLQLYVSGREVPVRVTNSDNGWLQPETAVEFYASGLDTPETDQNVYWLTAGSTPGKRIKVIDGSTIGAVNNVTPSAQSFNYTVERRERLTYFTALQNGEKENFFGHTVAGEAVEQTLQLNTPDGASSNSATVEIGLQGVSYQAHAVRITLNGEQIGTVNLTSRDYTAARFNVRSGLLRDGANAVVLQGTNGDADVTLIDYVRVTYPRRYRASNNALRFSIDAGQTARVEGFTSERVRLLDITRLSNVTETSATATQGENGYGVQIPAGNRRTFIALADDQAPLRPSSVTANIPSNLRRADTAADLVVITPRTFAQAIEPLVAKRRTEGYKVAVVDIEDVYDEFSNGAPFAQSVRDFLQMTRTTWATAPRYVLFVGDATYDPRNYLATNAPNYVPTKLVDTVYMESATDDWFSDFDNDGIAEMATGRLPVHNAAEAALVANKIADNDAMQSGNRTALFVSDQPEGHDFATANRQMSGLLPADVTTEMINREGVEITNVRTQIRDSLNRGALLVNYAGHGAMDKWTRDSLLNVADATALTNGRRLPLFVMMTCWNGYFVDPRRDALAEALLNAPQGGALAVWASSALSTPTPQHEMNEQFYRLLFADGEASTLGDAMMRAKHATTDPDVRRTWTLFGDPTTRLR